MFHAQGMGLNHDIIKAVIGQEADCQIVCKIPVIGYKSVELPEQRDSICPQQFVFEKEAGRDSLAETFIVRCLNYSASSPESLVNDRKNIIASGFSNFKNIHSPEFIDCQEFAKYASWVSYFDANENAHKVAYITYVRGASGVVGYEATVKISQGASVDGALQQLHRNYASRRILMEKISK